MRNIKYKRDWNKEYQRTRRSLHWYNVECGSTKQKLTTSLLLDHYLQQKLIIIPQFSIICFSTYIIINIASDVLCIHGPKGVMLLIFAPDIRVGRECLLNLHRIYLL
jgi:hypothetical protein